MNPKVIGIVAAIVLAAYFLVLRTGAPEHSLLTSFSHGSSSVTHTTTPAGGGENEGPGDTDSGHEDGSGAG